MFGRRNPDRPLEPAPVPQKTQLDLSILDELPDIIPAAPTPVPPADVAPTLEKPVSPPPPLGPSVTQLLREVELAGTDIRPAPITQQLAQIDLEPSFAAVSEAQWAQPEPFAAAPAPSEAPFYAEPPTLSSELGLSDETLWEIGAAEVAAAAPAASEPEPAPSEPAPAVATPLPSRGAAESLIGPDDFFDGHYRSERGVRVQGNARGSIESRQYILVEANAQVDADITAEEIIIAGAFSGKLICHGRLEIMDTGKVQGSIETAMLVVHEGGSLDGELHMRRGEV